MTGRPRPHPPSGMPAPVRARLPNGGHADLLTLAERVAARYFEAYPEHVERYGPAGWDWCVHDTQYLLKWAILDVQGLTSLAEQTAWLARVLAAREFPLPALRDNMLIAAQVLRDTGEPDLAPPALGLEAAAETVVPAPAPDQGDD